MPECFNEVVLILLYISYGMPKHAVTVVVPNLVQHLKFEKKGSVDCSAVAVATAVAQRICKCRTVGNRSAGTCKVCGRISSSNE